MSMAFKRELEMIRPHPPATNRLYESEVRVNKIVSRSDCSYQVEPDPRRGSTIAVKHAWGDREGAPRERSDRRTMRAREALQTGTNRVREQSERRKVDL
jgi:hypothetical protein